MNTFIGHAIASRLPPGDSLELPSANLETTTAIAAVLASVTATMAAVANLVVVLYAGY